MGRKVKGLLCPFRGERGPHNTVTWAEIYLRTEWHLDLSSRLATTDMGQKLGGLCPFWGWGTGRHLIQCGLGRCLYLHTKWHPMVS